MFSITVSFNGQPQQWALLFKDESSLNNALMLFDADHPTSMVTIADDFGQRLRTRRNDVQALLVEDMAISQLAHVERSIHHAKTQLKVNSAASADPALKMLRAGQQGGLPSFNPMGNGGRMM